jgi:hypothetical protein
VGRGRPRVWRRQVRLQMIQRQAYPMKASRNRAGGALNTALDYDGDAVRISGLADGHLDTRKSDTDLTIAVISLGPGARGNFSHGRYIVPDLPRW